LGFHFFIFGISCLQTLEIVASEGVIEVWW